MKRWEDQHAADVARRFASSAHADAWHLFGPMIRRALIDSFVLDELRIADSVDSRISFTATMVVAFRDLVCAKLAVGVKRHPRAPTVRFEVES